MLAGILLAIALPSTWQLVWSDEFNGSAGSPPDPTNWNYDLGGGGWGNGELEVYTNSPTNVFQDGSGNLIIRAIRDSHGQYTSARLQSGSPGAGTSTANGNWQYGRIEARIKIPYGQGVWPAFWMLGENISSVGWPTCGEIDIMENFGTFNHNATVNNGTAHGPGYSGGNGVSAAFTLPLGQTVYDDYHVYSLEWSPDSMQWFVDGTPYHTVTPASIPAGDQWVFNAPFFILLNLAIGGPGTFLGTPDASAPFPNQDMLVDYVRVYQAAAGSATTPVITPGSVANAASYLGTLAPGALAVLYGTNLADNTFTNVTDANGNFVTSVGNVSVSVDGTPAPLTYVSPTQINFQVPWATTVPGLAVNVQVTRASEVSNVEPITVSANASPALFLQDFTNGIAWMTGPGCETTECPATANGVYQLWVNGLGPKNAPEEDGVPAVYTGSLTPLEVPGGTSSCQLTIDSQTAVVDYCGAGPGEIIDQVNFTYPTGVTSTTSYVEATLTINGVSGHFRLPAPAN